MSRILKTISTREERRNESYLTKDNTARFVFYRNGEDCRMDALGVGRAKTTLGLMRWIVNELNEFMFFDMNETPEEELTHLEDLRQELYGEDMIAITSVKWGNNHVFIYYKEDFIGDIEGGKK